MGPHRFLDQRYDPVEKCGPCGIQMSFGMFSADYCHFSLHCIQSTDFKRWRKRGPKSSPRAGNHRMIMIRANNAMEERRYRACGAGSRPRPDRPTDCGESRLMSAAARARATTTSTRPSPKAESNPYCLSSTLTFSKLAPRPAMTHSLLIILYSFPPSPPLKAL